MLVLDLGVFHRRNREMSLREAFLWSAFWIGLAAAFAVLIYFMEGGQKTTEFVTGYVIEESLSIDNLFVFLTLFKSFAVPAQYQYKVLFYGIIGALVMRGIFIVIGVGLIARFDWVVIVFGIFLLYTAVKMFFHREGKDADPESNFVVRFARRHLRILPEYEGDRFFVKRDNLRYATPLFLVLLLIESSDVIFAADSIPAVLAVSKDAFIVYTSNVFAILGLRALYFALIGAIDKFRYLDEGIALILAFTGAKMIASHWYDLPTLASLGIIAAILAISIAASLLPRRAMRDKKL